MRDFSWNVFAVTGNIEAYLLFKQIDSTEEREQHDVTEEEERKMSLQ
jgi:hypothetical protein